ncbi:STAS/SEC14 domain-containing protein [Vibrio alfacsensis]|uniref:STAS/SEC14 domain-containing protein n=1 Tax=Vibrio alfacsensis TaxID=1074311 RepID=UPI00406894D9
MITHGITIGLERIDNDVFVSIKAIGKLTHADYERLVPMLDSVLERITEPKVKVLFDATDFQGWELRAAWDDLKLGISHGSAFDKVALVGSHKWQDAAAKVSNWFLSGEVRSFHDQDEALHWLLS